MWPWAYSLGGGDSDDVLMDYHIVTFIIRLHKIGNGEISSPSGLQGSLHGPHQCIEH